MSTNLLPVVLHATVSNLDQEGCNQVVGAAEVGEHLIEFRVSLGLKRHTYEQYRGVLYFNEKEELDGVQKA